MRIQPGIYEVTVCFMGGNREVVTRLGFKMRNMREMEGKGEEARWRTIRGSEGDVRRVKGNRNIMSLYAVQ